MFIFPKQAAREAMASTSVPRLLVAAVCLTSAFAHPSGHQPVADTGDAGGGGLAEIGHNGLRYRVNREWSKADRTKAPVANAHAMIEDREGQIYLVTDDLRNAFLVFEKDGTFVRSFGKGLQGGHGIDVITLDGEEHLIHVDAGWHQKTPGEWSWKRTNGGVTIVSKQGEILRKLPSPAELGLLKEGESYQPCDVAVTPDNGILVADGYASDRIFHFTADGELVRVWGGKKKDDPAGLQNAHGISIDTSDPDKPIVWVSSRAETKLKGFSLEGELLETIELPGAMAGQLFIRGDRMYTGVCWSREIATGKSVKDSGFVVVLDRKTRKVISAPGGGEPEYVDGKLQPMSQADPVFKHVHDLYVDSEGDIYVGEWNSGFRYPYKLELVSGS